MYKWCKIVMPWQGQWVLDHKGEMKKILVQKSVILQ